MHSARIRTFLLCLSFLVCASNAWATKPFQNGFIDLIPGEESYGGPSAYHTGTGKLYVGTTPSLGGVIQIVDPTTRVVSERIQLPNVAGGIWDMAVDSTNHRLYATSGEHLYIVNTTNNQLLGTISYGENVYYGNRLALDPGLQRVYVTDFVEDKLYVINTLAQQVVATWQMPRRPWGVAVNPSNHGVYVACGGANGSDVRRLAIFDGSATSVTPLGEVPFEADANLTPSSSYPEVILHTGVNKAYVALNGGSDSIKVVDTATNTVTKTLAYSNPGRLALDPGRNRLFVIRGIESFIDVYQTADDTHFGAVSTISNAQYRNVYGIAVNTATGDLCGATSDSATLFSGLERSGIVPLRLSPAAIAINSAAGKLYYATSENALLVVDRATNKVERSILLPGAPSDVAYNPDTNRIYTVSASSGHITAIDATDYSVIASRLVYYLQERRINPDNSITEVLATNSPHKLAIDTANNRVFVLQDNLVSIVPGNFETYVGGYFGDLDEVGFDCGDFVYDQTANRLYIGARFRRNVPGRGEVDSPGITIRSPDADSYEAFIEEALDAPSSTSYTYGDLALNSATGRLYAVGADPATGSPQLKVIDVETGSPTRHSIIARLSSPSDDASNAFGSLAVNEASNRLYAVATTTFNTMKVFTLDVETNTWDAAPADYPLSAHPSPIPAFDAQSNNLYVTHTRPNRYVGSEYITEAAVLEIFYDGPDNTPPSTTIQEPANGGSYPAILLRTGRITTDDLRSEIETVQVSLFRAATPGAPAAYWDGEKWVESATEIFFDAVLGEDGTWAFPFPTREEGFVRAAYTLHTRVTDTAGNTSDSTSNFNVTAPGTFVLSATTYTVAENAGTATVTVQRTGGSDGVASVQYNIEDGSARWFESSHPFGVLYGDYAEPATANERRLTFADGEASKTFAVTIRTDNFIEGPQTVLLSLSAPSEGAELGVTTEAVLTIEDTTPPNRLSMVEGIDLIPGPDTFAPSMVAVNKTTNRIYAIGSSNRNSSGILEYQRARLSVIDAASRSVLTALEFTGYISTVLVDESTNRLFVLVNRGEYNATYNELNVIDGATHARLAQVVIPEARGGGWMGLDQGRQKLYILNRFNTGTLAVFDASTLRFESGIRIPGLYYDIPYARLAYDEARHQAFIRTDSGGNRGTLIALDVISGTSTTVTAIPIVNSLADLAFNPNNGILYAIGSDSFGGNRQLVAIKASDLSLAGSQPLDYYVDSLNVDPGNGRVYVGDGENHLTKAYDATSLAETGTLPFATRVLRPLPALGRLVFANSAANSVGLVDPATASVEHVATASNPAQVVSVTRGGKNKLYVADASAPEVLVIDAAVNSVIARVPVKASALVYNASAGKIFATVVGNPTGVTLRAIDVATDTLDEEELTLTESTHYGDVPLASDPNGKIYAFVQYTEDGGGVVIFGAEATEPTSGIRIVEVDTDPASPNYFTTLRTVQTDYYAAYNAVFDPVSDRIYATLANAAGRLLRILPQSTLTESATLSIPSAPVGDDSLTGLALDPETQRLYRTGSTWNTVQIYDVKPGSPTENQSIAQVSVSHIYNSFGYGLNGIAIDSASQRVFVGDGGGDEGAVGIIDANTQQFTDTLGDIGKYPVRAALAFNADTQRLYAANEYEGMVWVFQNEAPGLPALPQPTDFTIETETPYINGVPWTLTVTTSADAAAVKFQVRKQSESDWRDLSGKVAQIGDIWRLVTSKIPAGSIIFRAVASAPNFAASNVESSVFSVGVNPNLPKLPAGKKFTATPQSPGYPWSFTFTQKAKNPGLTVTVQGSVDGETWIDLPEGVMIRQSGKAGIWTLNTADVPTNLRFFRAVSSADGYADTPSDVFSNLLPSFKKLKVSTKKPARSGQKWLFAVGFKGKAEQLAVRFQSTLTPEDEASWTDVPIYELARRKGSKWAQVTYNVPDGLRYFRAVASAPGWVDSVSETSGPIEVTPSEMVLPPVTAFNIYPSGDVPRAGEAMTFSAVQDSVKGATLRFQTKLSSEGDDKWVDLPDGGQLKRKKRSWSLETPLVPSGARDFRAISSAPQYVDSISTVISLTVQQPQAPQLPAAFSDFIHPAPNQRVFKTEEVINTWMQVSDPNGLQNIRIQFATTKEPFRDAGSGEMTLNPDGTYRNHKLYFSTPGTYFLRVAATDNASPTETSYSSYITILIGAGNGSTGPTFGPAETSVKQPTSKSKGSIEVRIPIGDDKQVYQAFLVRTDSAGVFQGYAGEMQQATKGNVAVRYLTDSNLNDGTYYYRILASDFDGMLSASPIIGPITLNTPAPPPAQPITITVASDSRLVNPTFPTTSSGKRIYYNHKDMPLPDHGKVRFSYSGLPSGKNEISIFKTSLGESRPYYTKTVSNSSGELNISAPEFDDNEPVEGEYEIRIYSGGRAFPLTGNSVNKFTVGHSWNKPDTFTKLDYGLYWFKDVRNGLKALGAGQSDEYFDPNKPTIIYVHGWQFGEVANKRRESWDRMDPVTKAHRDTCKIWKDLGYNVGIFYWNQFAWEPGMGLYKSEAKIYGGTGDKADLPAGHGMTYALYDSGAKDKMKIWINPAEFGNKGSAEFFYDELVRCLAGYQTSSTKEFRVVGHSLGTQVTNRAMWLLNELKPAGVPLPNRIALLDLAQTNTTTIPKNPGTTIPFLQKAYIDKLATAGVAIESYQSTDLQSFLGIIGVAAKPVYDATAYSRIRPDWIPPLGVADSHSEAVRWYSESARYVELPTYTYWAPFVIRDRVGTAISASTSTERIRSLMGGNLYFEQSEGKNTNWLSDDGFEQRWDRN